ncbi:MAG: LysM peptidoglycan-binding domain-containing protein [Treponema sp.]|nr:LysM peptidoglycan-binding domain-containing protein [Treponema sp.]
MKQIGIKLADGSFYPLLEEGTPAKATLDLTTASDNQTAISVDLYCSETGTLEEAEYIDTLKIDNLAPHPNGEPSISCTVSLDEDDELSVEINDPESGGSSATSISLPMRRAQRQGVQESERSENSGAVLAAGLVAGGALAAAALHKKPEHDDSLDFSDLDLPEDIDLTKPIEAADESPDDFVEPTGTFVETTDPLADISDDFAKSPDEFVSSSDEFTEQTADVAQQEDFTVPDASASDDFNFDADDFPTFDETSIDESLDGNAFTTSDDLLAENSSGDFFDANSEPVLSEENFDDIYTANETEEEQVSTKNQTNASVRKKTKIPVLICLLCALICVIATILILFVLPSRFNILRSHNGEARVNAPAEHAPVIVQQPPQSAVVQDAPAAKPNEIVVAPVAEKVMPEKPAAPAQTARDTVYRIKWGDTLWDIADAYYKNPWRYRRIAQYNNIRNPDYIISGTTIRIPAE